MNFNDLISLEPEGVPSCVRVMAEEQSLMVKLTKLMRAGLSDSEIVEELKSDTSPCPTTTVHAGKVTYMLRRGDYGLELYEPRVQVSGELRGGEEVRSYGWEEVVCKFRRYRIFLEESCAEHYGVNKLRGRVFSDVYFSARKAVQP